MGVFIRSEGDLSEVDYQSGDPGSAGSIIGESVGQCGLSVGWGHDASERGHLVKVCPSAPRRSPVPQG